LTGLRDTIHWTGRRAWAGAARAPETSTWIIAVMLVAVEILATVVWAFVL